MNNLSSYCGLVDAKIRASYKDLPVQENQFPKQGYVNCYQENKFYEIFDWIGHQPTHLAHPVRMSLYSLSLTDVRTWLSKRENA